MPTQVNWRFRQLCNAMFYDGLPSKFVCAGAGPPLGFHVGHRAGLIQAVDAIGGDRGVDVQGVLGVQGLTPAHGGKQEWEHRPADLGSPRQPVLPILPR
jgi:hypothetical protein